jgi:hypothetical protein
MLRYGHIVRLVDSGFSPVGSGRAQATSSLGVSILSRAAVSSSSSFWSMPRPIMNRWTTSETMMRLRAELKIGDPRQQLSLSAWS